MHKIAIAHSIIAHVKAQRAAGGLPEQAINSRRALSAALTDFA
jgi:hypothetical protein